MYKKMHTNHVESLFTLLFVHNVHMHFCYQFDEVLFNEFSHLMDLRMEVIECFGINWTAGRQSP